MPKFILLIFLVFISYGLKAQTFEMGGGIGGAGYMGDLNMLNPLKVSGPSGSLFIKYNFDGYWSLKAAFTIGSISAADSTSSFAQLKERNLSFTTTLYEPSILVEFNFFNYVPQLGRNVWTPYMFAGFAAVAYYPTTVYDGVKYDLRGLHTEGEKKVYSTFARAIPYGAGLKYNFAGSFTLGAEIGYRNPNTDYLDDVSTTYVGVTRFPVNSVAAALQDRSIQITPQSALGIAGKQRGNSSSYDQYLMALITLSWHFTTYRCPANMDSDFIRAY